MLSIRTAWCGVALLVLWAGAAFAQPKEGAQDWPGWRGADRSGVSHETGLLQEWPKEGPKLLWKVSNAGGGYSTPSIAQGRIYLLGSRDGEEYLLALAAEDGKELWATKIGRVGRDGPPSYPGPRCTPTINGDRIYALGSDGDLVCVGLDGKIVWQKSMEEDLGGRRGRWAYSESPLVDGEALICTPGGTSAALAALNKGTGEVLWKAAVPEGGEAAYSSIMPVEAGVRQYVQFLGNGLIGVAAKDGRFLWKYTGNSSITNCSTPIVRGNMVFASTSGRGPGSGGGALLELLAEGDNFLAKEVYVSRDLTNHIGGVVLVGDSLYGTSNQALVCIDFKTGETKWQDRSVGKGSILAADGRLYVRGEKGSMALVEATPEAYREKGQFTPERSGKNAWPYPVISGGRLYLRDDTLLLCYDVKQ